MARDRIRKISTDSPSILCGLFMAGQSHRAARRCLVRSLDNAARHFRTPRDNQGLVMTNPEIALLSQAALSAANMPNVESVVALARRGIEIMANQAVQRTLGAYEIEAAFRRDGVPPCRC